MIVSKDLYAYYYLIFIFSSMNKKWKILSHYKILFNISEIRLTFLSINNSRIEVGEKISSI